MPLVDFTPFRDHSGTYADTHGTSHPPPSPSLAVSRFLCSARSLARFLLPPRYAYAYLLSLSPVPSVSFPPSSPHSPHALTAWSIHESAGARQLARSFPGLFEIRPKGYVPRGLRKSPSPPALRLHALRSLFPVSARPLAPLPPSPSRSRSVFIVLPGLLLLTTKGGRRNGGVVVSTDDDHNKSTLRRFS